MKYLYIVLNNCNHKNGNVFFKKVSISLEIFFFLRSQTKNDLQSEIERDMLVTNASTSYHFSPFSISHLANFLHYHFSSYYSPRLFLSSLAYLSDKWKHFIPVGLKIISPPDWGSLYSNRANWPKRGKTRVAQRSGQTMPMREGINTGRPRANFRAEFQSKTQGTNAARKIETFKEICIRKQK